MNMAWLSVGALVLAVAVSCTTTINVGILSMAMALLVGVFFGGMTPGAVLEGFPVDLMVTLIGVTLLFSIAECNGTLARLTGHATRACRGHAGVLPIMFFDDDVNAAVSRDREIDELRRRIRRPEIERQAAGIAARLSDVALL